METKKKVLEKDIQREICDYLAKRGFFFWRSNNVPVFDKGHYRAMPKYHLKGLPDICILTKGLFIGVEVKRPHHTNKIQKSQLAQVECGRRILENEGYYYIVHSLDEFLKKTESDMSLKTSFIIDPVI